MHLEILVEDISVEAFTDGIARARRTPFDSGTIRSFAEQFGRERPTPAPKVPTNNWVGNAEIARISPGSLAASKTSAVPDSQEDDDV